MIPALDSAYPPTLGQSQEAYASGVRQWNGYIATKGGVNLLNPWSRAAFQTVQSVFGRTVAYASGWDDPVAVAQLAASWDVLLCLDNEAGIRPPGSWVQPWLDASGAGLYGLLADLGHAAPFYVVAGYPGYDPGTTWPNANPPAEPHGWQWQGSHTEFGVTVDRCWMDDWFAAEPEAPASVIEDVGTMRVVSCKRPDGATDQYYLTATGTLVHAVPEQSFWDQPPGVFQTLSVCGYDRGTPFVQGLASDNHVWQVEFISGQWQLRLVA
jgi:hypothetical protein